MTASRLVRTGRCRFFICFGTFALMITILAIFNNSQQELDSVRQEQIRCERQQEALNDRMQTYVEQKFELEKNYEHERNEHLETRRHLEQKVKDLVELHSKEQMEALARYEKLQETHSLLQSEYNDLMQQSAQSKKQTLSDAGAVEKRLELLQAERQQEKNALGADVDAWKQKFASMEREKQRLQSVINVGDSTVLLKRLSDVERIVVEYQTHCDYIPKSLPRALSASDIKTLNASLAVANQRAEKSFSRQTIVSPGVYRIKITEANATKPNTASNPAPVIATNPRTNGAPPVVDTSSGDGGGGRSAIGDADIFSLKIDQMQKLLPLAVRNNNSFILNSDENFQIPQPSNVAAVQPQMASPLSAPRNNANTTESAKIAQHVPALAVVNASDAITSSTSGLPSLALPPNQRKLPANVAPIPANIDELYQRDSGAKMPRLNGFVGAIEAGVAVDASKTPNNRHANVVHELDGKEGGRAVLQNVPQDVKGHDLVNNPHFNLPAEDDGNFFDSARNEGGIDADNNNHDKDLNNEDDDMPGGAGGVVGAEDIAVKDHNDLLDADNLNNEIAGDQGKEFPDGLRLEDGPDDDDDVDDYSNPGERLKGDAERN